MEEKVRLSYLYDFYGELLSQKQRDIFDAFVFQDLSLQELAQESGVSRQAVHEKVRRCISALEEYEKKLALLDKYKRIGELKLAIESELLKLPDTAAEQRESIGRLLDELSEVL